VNTSLAQRQQTLSEQIASERQALADLQADLNKLGSELAELVLPHVTELAKACTLNVALLRSYSASQMILRFQDYTPDVDEFKEELKWEAREYLDDKLAQLKLEGLADPLPYVIEGDPAATIIEYAKRTSHSLIAMCTHGRSGVTRWVLGSVTEKVVRHSENPVLVIRGK
jgi:nucleotide-binding universal stress UspA family protein